ncbi:hypothetical protein IEO21_01519 [Rhodonia placenta]|uniref:Uncharacterized protein n=1 Tax=Rhodonia placenta TaxID=104341 RepID=A0A8H7U5F9_9APHY|nr:hypothetical protein IEO21_01519 [Postia placenta]
MSGARAVAATSQSPTGARCAVGEGDPLASVAVSPYDCPAESVLGPGKNAEEPRPQREPTFGHATGLCVYEVDDPSRKGPSNDTQDEKDRLQKRVAELESVIRELKNKPHPRWVSGAGSTDAAQRADHRSAALTASMDMRSAPPSPRNSQQASALADCISPISPMSTTFSLPTASSRTSSRNSPFIGAMSSRVPSSPSIADSSPIDTPSPMTLSPTESQMAGGSSLPSEYDIAALLSSYPPEKAGLEDNLFNEIWDRLIRPDGTCEVNRLGEHCGCLHDPANYNVVLELSLRLRKAADALSRSSQHASGSCAISQNIAELDRFTSNALGNINAPPELFGGYRDRATVPAVPPTNPPLPYNAYGVARPNPPASGPTVSPPSLQTLQPWDGKPAGSYPSPPWDDSFMSWVPQRRDPRERWRRRALLSNCRLRVANGLARCWDWDWPDASADLDNGLDLSGRSKTRVRTLLLRRLRIRNCGLSSSSRQERDTEGHGGQQERGACWRPARSTVQLHPRRTALDIAHVVKTQGGSRTSACGCGAHSCPALHGRCGILNSKGGICNYKKEPLPSLPRQERDRRGKQKLEIGQIESLSAKTCQDLSALWAFLNKIGRKA